MKNNKILVCGDVHGQWGPLNTLINRKKPDIILQCGDWGWWIKFHNTTALSTEYETIEIERNDGSTFGHRVAKKWDQFGVKPQDTRIYWCDGNHEDHWDLRDERNYLPSPCEMQKNVFYMKRGSTITLPDGRIVLFMGGADSIDKQYRKIGYDWFPEELISQRDIHNLPDIDIDIVISHTCPFEFQNDVLRIENSDRVRSKFTDPSMHALSYILARYKPSLWFFGHFHLHKEGKFESTKWYCLDMIPNPKWWAPLPEA